jgi:dTDP-4-dehydrorhamnose reductase
MLLLLGGTGYVGQAFCELFERESVPYRSVSRKEVDYTNRDRLISLIRETKPTFLVNSAGYTGKPNVDACELHKAECLNGNAVLPGIIREACETENLPWGHVSSGCIYTGQHADGSGFTESDAPNFSFRTNNCSFYSGCKALGEECLAGAEQNYVWRLRIPFNNLDAPRNYLTKVMRYQRLLEATNSLSQLNEFVWACWQSWEKRIPYGIYNMTNPGHVTTSEVVALIQQVLQPNRNFHFFASEEEFMSLAAKTPRSNCILDSTKILSTGIALTPVQEAITQALRTWKS